MAADVQKAFPVVKHGNQAVITPQAEVEKWHAHELHMAAPQVLEVFKGQPPAGLVLDMTNVKFVPSALLAFLLRCQMLTKRHGTRMVLSNISDQARELLHLTSLESLWPVYATTQDALEALA